MSAPVPAAIRAMRASLKAAGEPALVDRLWRALVGLYKLYNLPPEPTPQDDGDMKRRRWCEAPHHLVVLKKNPSILPPTDDQL